MLLLALETTCDETAAAVIDGQLDGRLDGRLDVLASIVASQDDLHRRFGGVVPEIASRAHVERIVPVIDESLRKAGKTLDDLDAIAVAVSPGLAGSLLVGLVAAKTLCVTHDLPLVAVDHLHAHIFACQMAAGENVFPCVGFVVSGGHSHLYRCESAIEFKLLGGTIDDAAGEAFDKVASLLGLPYPGGPAIAEAAMHGDAAKYAFPRPLLSDDDRIAFSFSGLKTAVRYLLQPPQKKGPLKKGSGASSRPEQVQDRDSGDETNKSLSQNPKTPTPQCFLESRASPEGGGAGFGIGSKRIVTPFPKQTADVAASFQEAVVDCLVGKAELAIAQTRLGTMCVGGGVAANARLRERLAASAREHGYELYLAPPQLCTDNAAMGAIAVERFRAGLVEPLDLDITPGLVR